MDQHITDTNQRLFNRYGNVFAKPASPEVYVNHCHKLADWLSDFKAYYEAARPEIVKLLLVAYKTICTSVNADTSCFNVSQYPNNAMVQAYAKLVRSVEPFKEYFRNEPGSAAHLQALLATINHPFQPPISYDQTMPLNQQHPNEISNPGAQTSAPIEHDPEVVIIAKPPNFPDKKAQSMSNEPSIPKTVTSTRPKVKKRKTINFDLLVQEDIKGLQEKKAAQPPGPQPDEQDASGDVFSTSTLHTALIPEDELALTTEKSADNIDSKPDTPPLLATSSVETELLSESLLPPRPSPLSELLPSSDSLAPSKPLHPSEPLLTSGPLPPSEPLYQTEPVLPTAPDQSESLPPPESLPLAEPESPPGKLGSSLRVIARQEALAYQGRMTISFNISDSTYALVSNWVKANSDPIEHIPTNSCICFSFGCYLTSDLKKESNDVTFEEQLGSTQPTWPPFGSLSMNIQFKGKRENLPLSPPIKVTLDNLVDICPFIICGENTIDISQKQDLSQYTFVLFADWPSRKQSEQVRQNRKKEREWKNWMLMVTRPLKVPSIDYTLAI